MLDWKNFIVEFIPFVIWIVRDKVRCWPYHALLTRYLAIVYIDLLTKILDGVFIILIKILTKVQHMNRS